MQAANPQVGLCLWPRCTAQRCFAAGAPLPPRLPQGDRNDPFGSYLAGLRLGTGFL